MRGARCNGRSPGDDAWIKRAWSDGFTFSSCSRRSAAAPLPDRDRVSAAEWPLLPDRVYLAVAACPSLSNPFD
jgi:hypothetical protein